MVVDLQWEYLKSDMMCRVQIIFPLMLDYQVQNRYDSLSKHTTLRSALK
jgi:hypothetical protein